jgi:hypothetical protein
VTLLQASQPIVVRVVEQPVHDTSIADVIIGAIGLTGLLLLTAALLGAALGGILIGIKLLRSRYNADSVSDADALRIT